MDITIQEQRVLSTALQMSKGDFPWAYAGAPRPKDRNACAHLLERIESVDMHFRCECNSATMDDAIAGIAGEINISTEEALILLRALYLYTGKCPDAYAGASLWNKEANNLIIRLLASSHDGFK